MYQRSQQNTIRKKYVVKHVLNIWSIKKKALSLRHEKVDKVFNIYSNCMAGCTNYHIINLLYSGKFTNVNFTESKLAKSLHLKIGAKVIKKLNTNKLNYKIMRKILVPKDTKVVAICTMTPNGELQRYWLTSNEIKEFTELITTYDLD